MGPSRPRVGGWNRPAADPVIEKQARCGPHAFGGGRQHGRWFLSQAQIDVVIPVYNGGKTLESAVASIQSQTVRDIRIILVNDGSTDNSRAVAERIAASDSRVVVLNQPNGGIVDALNAGLAICDAEFIARHDADDLAEPDRFSKQLAWFRDHPACDAVSGAIIHMDENGRPFGPKAGMNEPDKADPYQYPQREPYLVHPFLMMRRSAVVKIGGYRHVYHAEDTDLYWRLQEVGQIANMDDLLGHYRIHNQSVTGASTLNGRISALSSQLCGLSAIRRRNGRPDIAFPRNAVDEYKQAGGLREIVQLGARGLDPDEATRLAAATSAKLIELAAYRPYELDEPDCTFIRESINRALPTMTETNRSKLLREMSGTAARLAAGGRLASALRLCPPRMVPQTAIRLAVRMLMPTTLRYRVRRLVGRPSMVK